MNELEWMTKDEFFSALDDPTNENDSIVFNKMNLFGPYYIQNMTFKECMSYPKDPNHVTYKDRFPLYRMCDLAYPVANPMGSATRYLRKMCVEKCNELQKIKSPIAHEIGLEMATFMKQQFDSRFEIASEGVMQAYHPISPYMGTVSRYEAEKGIGNEPVDEPLESTEKLMKKIGPRITNPNLSDPEDLDHGFGILGDTYNKAEEGLEKACAHFHLVAYGRYANGDDRVVEGFMFFDNPNWVNEKWDDVLEAIMDATTKVPPSIPTVNASLMIKAKDIEDKESSKAEKEKAIRSNFDIDRFRQFLAISQRYKVSSSSSTEFMTYAQYDYIAGYIDDGPVMHMKDSGDYVMPVIDLGESNAKKILVYHPGSSKITVQYFPSSHEIV